MICANVIVSAKKRWRTDTVRRGTQTFRFRWCEVIGAKPGPALAVIDGQHGMEPTGPGMVAGFLAKLDPAKLRGTLRAVPLASVEALRCGCECEIPPCLLECARKLGLNFGLPHLHWYPSTDHPGLLSRWTARECRTSITVELTPQNRVTSSGAELGKRGLMRLMRHLGMLPGREGPLPRQFLLEYRKGDRRPIRVPRDAIAVPQAEPGSWHRKGGRLGYAVRLDKPDVVRPLLAPRDGLFLGTTQRAFVAARESPFVFYRARPLPPL